MSIVGEIRQEVKRIRSRELDFLIFFVTGRCNARCRHCFYWQQLGADHHGLSADVVARLSRSMPPFRTLLLSGGEPFLREDLADLVRPFVAVNGIGSLSIPTNGLLPDRIAAGAEAMAATWPHVQVSINLSLDGFAETHDRLRGVPGTYERVLETLGRLADAKARLPNLASVVNTVILGSNYDQVVPLARHLQGTGLIDDHAFEIVRGVPRDERVTSVPPAALRAIYRDLMPIQEAYLVRSTADKPWWLRWWSRLTKVGGLRLRYDQQLNVFVEGGRWPCTCLAGESIAVVDYDGSLRVCELRDGCVGLEDYAYDYGAARDSNVIRSERVAAKSHECDCTHICFLGQSMDHDLTTRLLRIPLRYARYKLSGR